jgi:hypothetical protein
MEANDSWRNTQVLWDHYRDGLGTNAATEPPLEKQSVVWVGYYSKRHAEREVRISPQVLAFFE